MYVVERFDLMEWVTGLLNGPSEVLRDAFVCRWEIWPSGMGDGIIERSLRTISLLELLQILTIFPNLVFNNHFGNTLILSLLCFYTDIGWTSWSYMLFIPSFPWSPLLAWFEISMVFLEHSNFNSCNCSYACNSLLPVSFL